MTRLDLTDEQARFLGHLLERNLTELRSEISRTDSREFRDQLRHEEELNRQLLAVFPHENSRV